VALDQACHIIFLVDGRSEITGADRDLAQMLQRLGKRGHPGGQTRSIPPNATT